LGIVSRILAVRSSPDVVGSTVIPAAVPLASECGGAGSQLGHAELSSTRLTMVEMELRAIRRAVQVKI
jgi:hypothetical protein